MTKKFQYTTDLKETYGVSQLGLNKGDRFNLIETKLSSIEQTKDNLSVYNYEYLIYIPIQNRCFFLDGDMWFELVAYSAYVGE